ncbi:hypothetical protein NKI36_26850 [Mesorhizobium caraganae]|uniref:Integrase n=1 Tax=Mesorhizobium caraganae TaxID=483206 RepID=A0ABV1Z6M6_9HYPH
MFGLFLCGLRPLAMMVSVDLDLPDLRAKPVDRSGEEDTNLWRHRRERPIALV